MLVDRSKAGVALVASLNHLDRILLERLLGMSSGYVLDFSDSTYPVFFRDFNVDIDHERYHRDGRSKARRG